MLTRSRAVSVVITVATAISLLACSSTDDPRSGPQAAAPEDPAAERSLSESPSPSAASSTTAASADTGTLNVRTREGYTYTVNYRYAAVGRGESRIENAAPGFTDVYFPITQGTITVVNTTSGRNAPGLGDLGMGGLYKIGRPACVQHDYTKHTLQAGDSEDVYCLIYVSILEPVVGSIGAGQTVSYAADPQSLASVNNVHYLGIPENTADAPLADMAAGPDIKIFGLSDSPLSYTPNVEPFPACYLRPSGREPSIHVLRSWPLDVSACSSASF